MYCNISEPKLDWSLFFFCLFCLGEGKVKEYLQSEWISISSMWCKSKIPPIVNTWNIRTNNHIESFHRVLKYCQSEKRKLRVDELLQLLSSSVSSHFKRLLETPARHRVREVLERRFLVANSQYVTPGRVKVVDSEKGVVEVQSKSTANLSYLVQLVTNSGPTCTCPALSTIQCTHIIAAALFFPRTGDIGIEPSIPRAYPASSTQLRVTSRSDNEEEERQCAPQEPASNLVIEIKSKLDKGLADFKRLTKSERMVVSKYLRQLSFALEEPHFVEAVTFPNIPLPSLRKKARRGRRRDTSEIGTTDALAAINRELGEETSSDED